MRYVIGYASLLSETSIGRLFPNAGRITRVTLDHHARCFNSFGTLSLKAGLETKGSPHLAHASAIYHPNSTLHALAFELDDADYQTYVRHEFRYDLKTITVQTRAEKQSLEAIICYENVDQNIDATRVGSASIWDLYETYDTQSFWHTTHLPAKIYLEHCIASARDIGPDMLENFLDASYLHDRKTSMRSYLEENTVDLNTYVKAAQYSATF